LSLDRGHLALSIMKESYFHHFK